jgi:Bacterial signalling protein N terminal repeat
MGIGIWSMHYIGMLAFRTIKAIFGDAIEDGYISRNPIQTNQILS